MAVEHLRRQIDKLQQTPLRAVVAAGTSIFTTARRRAMHAFFLDRDGDWVNWQRHATFVSPTPHRSDARVIESIVLEHWSYRYLPKPGDTVVDVGAGIGEETVFYSRLVGPRGRVISIEAHPRTFACLQKTIKRNHLRNVTAIHCAIMDTETEVRIDDDVVDHLANSVVGRHGGAGVLVPGRTLDTLLPELGVTRVDLLKMNIEGAERNAMRGMVATLDTVNAMAISCHDFVADAGGPDSLRTRAEVAAFVEQHGFDVVRRADDPRNWVRDYLYAAPAAPAPGPSAARARAV